MDRVKESVFSSIAAEVPGASVLDLYAGAGSFGIEAMSRGADSVTFVESSRAALDALDSNLDALGIRAVVVRGRVEERIASLSGPFDLVFCDPPWPLESTVLARVLAEILPLLAADTTIVITRRTGDPAPEVAGLRIDDVRAHGGTTIIRYVIEQT